jgi:hypothetical protein
MHKVAGHPISDEQAGPFTCDLWRGKRDRPHVRAASNNEPETSGGRFMSNWEDEINRHTAELVKLTLKAADQGPEPLPEDEVAKLGILIATERQLLIDAMSGLLDEDEPEAAASPGVAEFDAGFLYGLAFAGALDDAKMALDRMRRGRVLKLAKGNDNRVAGDGRP